MHTDSPKHHDTGVALTPEDLQLLPSLMANPQAILWDKRHNNLLYIVTRRDGAARVVVNAAQSLKRQPDSLDVLINAYRITDISKIKSDIAGGMLEVLEGEVKWRRESNPRTCSVNDRHRLYQLSVHQPTASIRRFLQDTK